MVNVFFVPGMFGSTIEYVLRNYTKEYKSIEADILSDGSMHSYSKEFHPIKTSELNSLSSIANNTNIITTIIYPFSDAKFNEILAQADTLHSLSFSSNIMIYSDTLSDCELNILFQYYKISIGVWNMGLEIFTIPRTFKEWNIEYTSWKDLQRWEYREWFSIFYPTYTSEWRESFNTVDDTFLKVNNTDFLHNPEIWTDKIIKHCGLTKNENFSDFFVKWKKAQKYIIDKKEIIETIVSNTISEIYFEWDALTVIEEAIIQQKLRSRGYEIKCDGLNEFPIDTQSLNHIIYKV